MVHIKTSLVERRESLPLEVVGALGLQRQRTPLGGTAVTSNYRLSSK
jgi:hypothetical protein